MRTVFSLWCFQPRSFVAVLFWRWLKCRAMFSVYAALLCFFLWIVKGQRQWPFEIMFAISKKKNLKTRFDSDAYTWASIALLFNFAWYFMASPVQWTPVIFVPSVPGKNCFIKRGIVSKGMCSYYSRNKISKRHKGTKANTHLTLYSSMPTQTSHTDRVEECKKAAAKKRCQPLISRIHSYNRKTDGSDFTKHLSHRSWVSCTRISGLPVGHISCGWLNREGILGLRNPSLCEPNLAIFVAPWSSFLSPRNISNKRDAPTIDLTLHYSFLPSRCHPPIRRPANK